MEASVKPVEVLMQSGVTSSSLDDESPEGHMAAAMASPPLTFGSSETSDPMEEFQRRLDDIIRSSTELQQGMAETETMKTDDDITVTVETEVSVVMQSLNTLSSPEDKLQDLLRKYTELATLRHSETKQRRVLQQQLSLLMDERRHGVEAQRQLEALCGELQTHYGLLREETVRRCREDEEKRKDITCHFQKTMTDIQAQIDQQSARNAKLCGENANLTEKLESLMNQCELREESLEKINRHRDLQHKLTDAKLQQANALLADATDKHKREKEYLLREAIDKTKKCFAMKEQELAMKKKLTLYAQKFDEFQATLAKSNEIYIRFKQEMNNMTDKMKKLEKESSLWKTRFENCNKALTDMIEERSEKSKEFDLFVLKIQKLERLCRALQDERKGLYDKIKDVRQATRSTLGSAEDAGKSPLLTPTEVQELQDEDPVLTEDMARLKEEQAKLQQFAATLLDASVDEDVEDEDDEDEDVMASAFIQFKAKTQVKDKPATLDPRPEEAADSGPAQDAQKPDGSRSEEPCESVSTDPKHEAGTAGTKQEPEDPAEDAKVQQPESAPDLVKPDTDPEPEPAAENKPEVRSEDGKVQQVVLMPDPVSVKPDPKKDPEPAAENKPEVRSEDGKVQQVVLMPDPVSVKPDPKKDPEPAAENKPDVPAEDAKVQQPESAPDPVKPDPKKDPEPAAENKVLREPEVKPEVPAEDAKVQQPESAPDLVKPDPHTHPEPAAENKVLREPDVKPDPKKDPEPAAENKAEVPAEDAKVQQVVLMPDPVNVKPDPHTDPEPAAENTVEPEVKAEVQQTSDPDQVSEETPKYGADKAATPLEKPAQKKKKKRSPKASS